MNPPKAKTELQHPYQRQPDRAFWRRSVAPLHPLDIKDWYRKKFEISERAIATAGSCFAQHIGRHLRSSGFRFIDVEPPPSFLPPAAHLDFGYSMYSARYGNVYTPRQLLQLVRRATGEFKPNADYWAFKDGVVDPFRPSIEPAPFSSVEELRNDRKEHLRRVATIFEKAELFVFTLGLTEAWVDLTDGAVFPVAPGTAGGMFDPHNHALHNLTAEDCISDMKEVIALIRSINPEMHFLLTVSPVPLMATATADHVIVATTYSKSVLRAAAGLFAERHAFVDYFPSYEIITAPALRGQFFDPDQRSVNACGVEHVMKQFFIEHQPPQNSGASGRTALDEDDVACDEELLEVFGA